MSLKQKIRQKAKTIAEVDDSAVILFNKIRTAKRDEDQKLRQEWFDFLTKKRQLVNIDDVVALLDEATKNILTDALSLSQLTDSGVWSKERYEKMGKTLWVDVGKVLAVLDGEKKP